MGRRRQALIFSLLALAVPLPAFAVQTVTAGGDERSISVSVALDRCGLLENSITCRIDASWTSVDGADHYTVSVIRPDGSVLEMGSVAGTSATAWVGYAGAGDYAVEVSAWGRGPDPDLIATEIATNGAANANRIGNFTIGNVGVVGGDDSATEVPGDESPPPEPDEDCSDEPPADPEPAEDPLEQTTTSAETAASAAAETTTSSASTEADPAESAPESAAADPSCTPAADAD